MGYADLAAPGLGATLDLMIKHGRLRGTFVRACSEGLWGPVIRETVELFGPGRCMFGSNFPIEKLWTTYAEVVRVTVECLAGLSAEEQRAVLHGTADRVYRLGA